MSAPVHDPQAPWHRGRWGHDAWSGRPPRSSARARLLVPVLVSLLIQVPFAVYALVRAGADAMAITGLALAIAGPLALLAARRFPGPTVAVVAVAAALDGWIAQSQPTPPYIALTFAIVGAIVRGARLWAWISVGSIWVVTIVAGLMIGVELQPTHVAASTLLILIVFGIGEVIRTRRDHFERYQQALSQRRHDEVQAERTRIARELHDVLAHSLSQINVQAGVGLHLMDAHPEKAKEALASIKDSSKSALDEVRSLLGVLRAGTGQDAPLVPEPDLARLPGLIDSVRTQGLDVTLDLDLDDAPKAAQLAIYRIVQESLTNVIRHAGAKRATVTIGADADAIVIEVADDGRGIDALAEGGRGLLGMHERAELLGGTLATGRSSLGGALVTARIPTKETLA